MDDKQFYVRVRGKVTGPFGLGQLKSLRDRGQFRRFHEISEDKKSWVPASTISDLFPEVESRKRPEPEPHIAAAPVASTVRVGAVEPAASTPEWFYIDENGNENGPVARDQLLELWQAGAILPATQVWKDGMPDWLPISSTGLDLPLIPYESVGPGADAGLAVHELDSVAGDGWKALGRFFVDPVGGLPDLCHALGGGAALGLGLIFCFVFFLCLLLGMVFTIFGIGKGLVPQMDGPGEIIRFDKPRPGVAGQPAFPFGNNDWKKEFGRFMVFIVLTALLPFAGLGIAITIIRTVTGGSGQIGFDFLTSGAALLPIGLLSPIVPLLGLGNLEVILFLYMVALCLTILILNCAFTRIIKLSDRGSILAIPCSLVLTIWLSKVVIVAVLSW
jgi:hypothetical protein